MIHRASMVRQCRMASDEKSVAESYKLSRVVGSQQLNKPSVLARDPVTGSDLCPVCERELVVGLAAWHRRCPGCSYEGSTLSSRIMEQATGGDLDEAARKVALESLRQKNFKRLATWLEEMGGKGRRRLLEVGCAHGWFLAEAQRTFDVIGIEPDANVNLVEGVDPASVRAGFFPDALAGTDRFDVIVFNDVLEHIPDLNGTLAACAMHLTEGGIIVINAPSSRGFLYRLAKVLSRLGLKSALNRLWQVGFPSPHLHYFDTRTIEQLARRHGLRLTRREQLPSFTVKGLYARLRFGREVSRVRALAVAAPLTLLSPVLSWLPSDIEVWFLQKN